jgi:hypothetical protein
MGENAVLIGVYIGLILEERRRRGIQRDTSKALI